MLSLILFIPFAFSTPIRAHANGHGKGVQEGITVVEFPHYQVGFPDSTCFMGVDLDFKVIRLPFEHLVHPDSNYPWIFG